LGGRVSGGFVHRIVANPFRIDHPLDPAHKYLQQSFVESPDMNNLYHGVVTTDRRGLATVKMPAYFQALNRSFRYQLTTVGQQSSGATAGVWREIVETGSRSAAPAPGTDWAPPRLKRREPLAGLPSMNTSRCLEKDLLESRERV
jgi:hypothetical protein